MPAMNFPVFDGDNHLYETEDAFTRHLPVDLEGMFKYVQVSGRTKIAVRGVLSDYIPNPTFEVVARPGAHMDYYANRNTEGKTMRELGGAPMRVIPAFRNPGARVELLDELGIDAALLFPTLASLVEVSFMDLPEQTLTILHAFNQWILDDWTFDYENRLFATPIVNPANPERAVAELEWLLDNGARIVLLRPAPIAGNPKSRSPFLPEFDPFWARVQEAGVPVAMHGSDSGYQRYINDWDGTDAEMSPFKPRAFSVAVTDARRPIQDSIFSAICHGMLTRFPDVRLVSVENGGMWVLQVLASLDHVYGKLPQEFSEHPRDTFQRCVYVNPFWEDPVDTLIDAISADRLIFGSDYPHPEGLAVPLSYADHLSGCSDEDRRKVMGGNLYDLLGVKVPA